MVYDVVTLFGTNDKQFFKRLCNSRHFTHSDHSFAYMGEFFVAEFVNDCLRILALGKVLAQNSEKGNPLFTLISSQYWQFPVKTRFR